MEFLIISTLNGLSYGLLLFMLSSGLTLIFSMMGVLNFAHASFYMLGAYIGFALGQWVGFWFALVLSPLVVGVLGAAFEHLCLRRVHSHGNVPELLVTFGLSFIVLEIVQLVLGRIPLEFHPPEILQGPVFTLLNDSRNGLSLHWASLPMQMCQSDDASVRIVCSPFPAMRALTMLAALLMLMSVALLLAKTRFGLIIKAALTHPEMVEALGHNVPRVFTLVFAAGCALAGLAGVISGSTFLTEPAMAASVGTVIFVVVVVGGMGSLQGAFLASLLIGLVQTFAVAIDFSLISFMQQVGMQPADALRNNSLMKLTVSQVAPILPYLLLVLMLIFRPQGLLGKRQD